MALLLSNQNPFDSKGSIETGRTTANHADEIKQQHIYTFDIDELTAEYP